MIEQSPDLQKDGGRWPRNEQTLRAPDEPHNGASSLRRPLRVFMMDLLAIVPYYDGHLCAALLERDDLEIVLGAITYAYDPGYFRRQGVRNKPGVDLVSRLKLPSILRRPCKALEAALNLVGLSMRLLTRPPHVLHVQFLPMMEFGIPFERWVLWLARRLGVRVVHTVHNVLPPATNGQRGRIPHAKLYRTIYRSADALICHDERAKARVAQEFGVRPERLWVIPHGPLFANACKETREEARARLRIATDRCLVLWQGILEPYKGVGFLLQAWREILGMRMRAQLAIVGSGAKELLESIRTQVVELGLTDSVRLEPRFVSVEEVGHWYRAADVLVYPYREGTTSGALMTGINFGAAIVATATPGFQQILRHGENALLVNYGDVRGLANELRRLISDEGLRRRLGERISGLQATSPGWSSIAKETVACYEGVVNRRHNA